MLKSFTCLIHLNSPIFAHTKKIMGNRKRNHLIGYRLYGSKESPTGEYTAQIKTTLPPPIYAAFLHFRKNNVIRESDACRMLISCAFSDKETPSKHCIDYSAIKERMQVTTTLKGKLYKRVFTFWRENFEPSEADLLRMLITSGLIKYGYTWK